MNDRGMPDPSGGERAHVSLDPAPGHLPVTVCGSTWPLFGPQRQAEALGRSRVWCSRSTTCLLFDRPDFPWVGIAGLGGAPVLVEPVASR